MPLHGIGDNLFNNVWHAFFSGSPIRSFCPLKCKRFGMCYPGQLRDGWLAGWLTGWLAGKHLARGLEQRRESFLSATAFTPLFAKCKLQNDIRGVDSRLHQRGLAPFPRKVAGCQDGRMAEWQGESGMWKVESASWSGTSQAEQLVRNEHEQN